MVNKKNMHYVYGFIEFCARFFMKQNEHESISSADDPSKFLRSSLPYAIAFLILTTTTRASSRLPKITLPSLQFFKVARYDTKTARRR